MTDFFEDLKRDLEIFEQDPHDRHHRLDENWLQSWDIATQNIYDKAACIAKLALLLPELRSALVYALDDARGWIDCEGELEEHGFDASGAMMVCEVVSSALAKFDAAMEEIGQ